MPWNNYGKFFKCEENKPKEVWVTDRPRLDLKIRDSVLSFAILPSVTGPQCKGAKGCGLRDGLPPGGGPEAFEFDPPTRKAPEKLGPETLHWLNIPTFCKIGSWAPAARTDGMVCRPSGVTGAARPEARIR